MSRQVEYGKQCRIESLGRNRYIKTTGLDIVTQADELLLFPLNARGARTDSCRIVVPMTAAPELADALIGAATPTLHDQLGFWPPKKLPEIEYAPPTTPDPDEKNVERARWAGECVRLFQKLTGTDDITALQDLLCDLMHFSDQAQGFQRFETALAASFHHYDCETTDPEEGEQ